MMRLPTLLRTKLTKFPYISIFSLMLVYWFAVSVHAAETTKVENAGEMLKHIVSQVPELMKLVTAVAYVVGFYFIFIGITKLKHMGEMRTQMSYEHSIKAPLVYLIVGALLIYLPTAVEIGTGTFWSNPSPYGYIEKNDQWSELLNDCIVVVQLFGVIAFIRGLIILTQMGGHSSQPGVLAKGMTHIVGGILCINIYQFVKVILITLGIQT